MARGDHFFVWRNHMGVPYQHHAIDVGDGSAVHFTDGKGGTAGPTNSYDDFVIQRTPIENVTRQGRDKIHIVEHRNAFDADVVVQRAISQVGRQGYHFVFDNCEHFACWCAIDRNESRQVQVACERLSAISVKTIAATGFRIASRFGTKRFVKGASPVMIVSDVAQWATEAGGHHLGLKDPSQRKKAGRAVGGATALGLGTLGGPLGMVVAGGIWAMGEIAGEVSRDAYQKLRDQNTTAGGKA